MSAAAFSIMPTKETAACCVARRDALGRPPIGFCGPVCIRREARTRLAAYHAKVGQVWEPQRKRKWRILSEIPGWEPWRDEWDDATADEALERIAASSHLAGPS